MTHWSASLIGLPFKGGGRLRSGCDCYGLCVLDYRENLATELPSYDVAAYDRATPEQRQEIAAVIARGEDDPVWRRVAISEARPHDLLVFHRRGVDSHVGLFVDADRMLHTDAAIGQSRIEGFDPRRVSSAYRLRELDR